LISTGYLGDMQEYEIETRSWMIALVKFPAARYLHAAASADGQLFIHGGHGSSGVCRTEIYICISIILKYSPVSRIYAKTEQAIL